MLIFRGNKARYLRLNLKFRNIKTRNGIFIGKGSRIVNNTSIGRGTRINGQITIKGSGSCTIGNFCALGDQILIITSNHRTDMVLLQYRLLKQIGIEDVKDPKADVSIGHNVWIGDRVTITAGVTIGNGAVIGAGSVVTKDVPPYTITAGVPARVIRNRFDDQRISELESEEWWEWPIEKIKENKAFFK